MSNKWYFPYGENIEKQSTSNARIETFRDKVIESLAREVCQNSLDAALDSDKTVKIEFQLKELELKNKLDFKNYILEIIPKALETWKGTEKDRKFLLRYKENLEKAKVKVLRISDYNTTGLLKENWESLIENSGTSVKQDSTSAGSFGIGKAAPFANSNLRMVFYNTVLENNKVKSIGVNQFVSFIKEGNIIAQGVGYFGKNQKEPFENSIDFGFKKRETSGTDIYIIGFEQDNWEEKLKNSILDNFMLSIYEEKLSVKIENIDINKGNIRELIYQLDNKKFRELKNYYSVLIDENKKIIELDERFEKYQVAKNEATLILSKKEDANRTVLMSRKAGMKIFDKNRISASIQFNGIFQAKGNILNEILKKMENPSHNDWIPDRYEEDVKKSEKLLTDIYRFIKEKVKENYEEKTKESIDAIGLNDFLPNRINRKDVIEGDKIKEKKSEVIKLREVKNPFLSENSGDEDFLENLETSGLIEDGDEGGTGSPRDTNIQRKNGENNFGVGETEGEYKENTNGRSGNVVRFKSLSINTKNNIKIIEKNYKNGEYGLFLNIDKEVELLKVEIKLIGETGKGYENKIRKVVFENTSLELYKNTFLLSDVEKGKSYLLEFEIDFEQRVKMEVILYEKH